MDLEKLSEVKHISEWLPRLGEDLYKRGDKPTLSINSLPTFSRLIWGLKEGGLTVIGARTSQGKSSFALQIANDIASQGIPVWFLSLEMSVPDLLERLFCHTMYVDNYSVLSGQMKMDRGIQRKFLQFKEMCEDSSLLITEGIGKGWEEIYHLIEAVGEKPKVIIVDYIQNIAFRSGETREIINDYIRKFRNLAIKHNFAGILCSQINRGAEDQKGKEPALAQLKETGFLEESADMAILLHWRGFYDKVDAPTTEYIVNVAKNRNGRTGEHKFYYTPMFYRFTETTKEIEKFLKKEAPDHALAAAGEKVEKVLEMFGGSIIDGERDVRRTI